MRYQVEIPKHIRKKLATLPLQLSRRITSALLSLEDNPRPPGALKLTGEESWRIRVGDYRIVYEIHDQILVVIVLRLGHRGDIYR